MGWTRTASALLTLCVCTTAAAQTAPADPYGPDPVLGEQIAEELVGRAQELLDAKLYLDAKQLAVEALVKSPKGNAADRARHIIKVVNGHLDIKEDPTPTPPSEVKPSQTPPLASEQVDMSPIGGAAPFDPSRDPPPNQAPLEPDDRSPRDGKNAATVHSAIYGGVIGATIGAYAGGDNPASVAVPLGIATGIGAGLVGRRLVRRLEWDEAQIRTVGSMNLWGGVLGGLFGAAVSGAGEGDSPSASGVLLGAAIGSTAGALTGVVLARKHKLTRGDVVLVDTLAGIGAVGGLTMGMLMQPAQNEAYAVNSILGTAAGVVVGVFAGPQSNTTPRRMLRVAGIAAAGGAVPFLLYAAIYDGSSAADERVIGLLSSAGLVGGAYLGFRLTRGMDAGLDVSNRSGAADAPAAVVGRSSDGTWSFNGLAVAPLSRQLASGQRGIGMTLLGARF